MLPSTAFRQCMRDLAEQLQPQMALDAWGKLANWAARQVPGGYLPQTQDLWDCTAASVRQVDTAQDQTCCLTYLAALLDRSLTASLSSNALPALHQEILLPILTSDAELLVPRRSQIVMAFSHLLAAADEWGAAASIIDLSVSPLSSVQASGVHYNQAEMAGANAHCLVISALLQTAAQQMQHRDSQSQQELQHFLAHSINTLQPAVCTMLSSQSAAQHSQMLSRLLPDLIAATAQLDSAIKRQLLDALWTACRTTIEIRNDGWYVAMAAIVRHANFFMSVKQGPLDSTDIRSDPAFWKLMRELMADDDAFTRKQALHVVEHAVKIAPEASQPAWAALLQLFALLEDFALHLIQAAWESLVGKVHEAAGPLRQETPGRFGTVDIVVDSSWLAVLWQRSLTHPSPAVQMFTLNSLMHSNSPGYAAQLPVSCVLEAVLPAFCRGATAGKADIEAGRQLMKSYAAAAPPTEARLLVLETLRLFNSSETMAAAQKVLLSISLDMAESVAVGFHAEAGEGWHQRMISQIKHAAANAAQLKTRHSLPMLTDLLRLASIVCPSSRVSMHDIGSVLAELPLACLQPGGALLPPAGEWLACTAGSLDGHSSEILGLIYSFFANESLTDHRMAADYADRLARLLLVTSHSFSSEALRQIFGLVQERVMWLANRPYLPQGLPVRTIALLASLLQVASGQRVKSLTDNLQQSIQNITSCLGSYMLRCCSLIQVKTAGTAAVARQRKATVVMSSAAESVLSDELQAHFALAHMSVQATADALALLIANKTDSKSHSSNAAQTLVDAMMTQLHGTIQSWQSDNVSKSSYAADVKTELLVEELAIVGVCCTGLSSAVSWHRLDLTSLPAKELLAALLNQSKTSTSMAALCTARWQAIESVLALTVSIQPSQLPHDLLAQLLAEAAADAELVPESVLVPLLHSIRVGLEAAAACPGIAFLAAQHLACIPARSLMGSRPTQQPAADPAADAPHQAASQHATDVAYIVRVLAEVCWGRVMEEARLQAHHYQALLDAFLRPCLGLTDSPEDLRQAVHGEGGPLQCLLQQLLHAGRRSPRLLALTALHLAPLFLANPQLALLYQTHIQQLLLCGASFDPPQAAAAGAGNLQEPQSDALFDEQQAASMQMSPRVAAACLVHQLAHISIQPPILQSPSPSDAAAAGELCWKLYQSLLEEPVLQSVHYQVNSATHRAKTRIWQALAVLSPVIPQTDTHQTVAQLWPLLQGKDVFSVQQYMESIAVNLILRDPAALMQQYVLPTLQTYNAKQHDGVASALLIGMQVIRHAHSSVQAVLWAPFVAAAWPWTMWHHHAIRTFAQLALHQLLEDCPQALPQPQGSPSPWQACLDFFCTNPDMKRLKKSLGSGLRTYSPEQAIAPSAVFCTGSQLAGSNGDKVGVEGAPIALMESVTEFLNVQRASLRQEARHSQASWRKADSKADSHETADLSSDFQRKMMPMQSLVEPSDLLHHTEDSHAETKSGLGGGAGERQDIILVASLIDKVPNLAGLTRTCEVFRAAALVVADKHVMKDPMFASVSVTAEQWVPLLEVAEPELNEWMLQKRTEGYCLIGVEQTAESKMLHNFAFPRKTILLLGREREGIPVHMLQLLHFTVEIPQLGVIRSLNVHVSGAIALYEYSKQQTEQAALVNGR